MARAQADLHGTLVVDKPGYHPAADDGGASLPAASTRALPTSHDVVQRVRRAGKQRRIGHTGTLDPMASGVLVLCLGRATRLVEYYQGHDKSYRAGIRLGTATDTYDALGAVMDERPVPVLDPETIESALNGFRGEIMQVPPLYSALKRDGESLHRKARRGESVTLAPRPIVIHELTLVEWLPPAELVLHVRASAGTYVRSLAHDLGQALGTVAHLQALRREAAGPFTLVDAHTLTAVEDAARQDRLQDLMLPVGARLGLTALQLEADTARRAGFGQQVTLARPVGQDTGWHRDLLAAAHDADGRFLGVMRCLQQQDEQTWLWKAEKWLASAGA